MTDKPDRDGILDPRASESVALPSEIEAFDRWAAEPDNLAAWEAARRWLAHAAGDVDDVMDVARTALLLAPDGPERERARRELLDLLADPDGADGMGKGVSGLFDVRPGPVMVASYEDPAGVSGWRLRELARARGATDAALERIHVAHTAGLPLYGPPDNGLYNARPEPMRGWAHLWAAADIIRPALVVIDPALDAYTGDPNNLAPGGRRGSVGRRRQGSPDTDRPGRQPDTGNRQGQLGPRLRPDAAHVGGQRCRRAGRIRRAGRLD